MAESISRSPNPKGISRFIDSVEIRMSKPTGNWRTLNQNGFVEVWQANERIVAIGKRLWKGVNPQVIESIKDIETAFLMILNERQFAIEFDSLLPSYRDGQDYRRGAFAVDLFSTPCEVKNINLNRSKVDEILSTLNAHDQKKYDQRIKMALIDFQSVGRYTKSNNRREAEEKVINGIRGCIKNLLIALLDSETKTRNKYYLR